MPTVFPFHAIQYNAGSGDLSQLVAPPYDVLSADQKAKLIAKNEANVVGVDLPHVPAKELGPPAAYEGAAATLKNWLAEGIVSRSETPAMFAYRQRFDVEGRTYERCGMSCAVETVPLGPREGGGVLPHEQTFSGPKEDRMALMKATKTQLSPIFGLHPDEDGKATEIVRAVTESRAADATADLGDGVTHEIWTISDRDTTEAYQAALEGEDVFIADGHHRYNTAVNYLASLEADAPIPADHPARRTMFVMVSMSDPGLYIGPTHRVLGGMADYSLDAFKTACEGKVDLEPVGQDPRALDSAIASKAAAGAENVLGVIDFASGSCFLATPAEADPLAGRFADKPRAWRTLDVALVQHLIVEDICVPKLNGGKDVKWAFPHSMDEVIEIGSGAETGAGGGGGFAQIAVIVRPTPLDAVREISHANELMPQKSTFFFPKLATGLFINPLA
ncbi:MAG: hypothetical protein CMJ31_15075 [Phycisphaerae bacterium]|nr:hypothetical protein [Phycisphaerae bacterium]